MLAVSTLPKYLLLVFVYLWHLMAAIFRSIYWFVVQRNSRVSRLAYQLEQLNAREEELSTELDRLNEQYLTRSAAIQARRSSVALERAKVLDELAETTKLKSNGKSVKTVPVITCNDERSNVAVLKTVKPKFVKKSPTGEIKPAKPKLSLEKTCSPSSSALQRSLSLTVNNCESGRESPNVTTRPISPFLAAKALIFERPRTPVEYYTYAKPPSSPTIANSFEPMLKKKKEEDKIKSFSKQQQKQTEQTNNCFSNLVGFNLATHRVNEYIDLIVDSTITEFRNCDRELCSSTKSGSKRGERFRATIKELYDEPEWRPFINDLRAQYKIFCYL